MWGVLWENQLDKQINRYSDYWSFGITLIEHVFGRDYRQGKLSQQTGLTSQYFTRMANASSELLDLICRLLVRHFICHHFRYADFQLCFHRIFFYCSLRVIIIEFEFFWEEYHILISLSDSTTFLKIQLGELLPSRFIIPRKK